MLPSLIHGNPSIPDNPLNSFLLQPPKKFSYLVRAGMQLTTIRLCLISALYPIHSLIVLIQIAKLQTNHQLSMNFGCHILMFVENGGTYLNHALGLTKEAVEESWRLLAPTRARRQGVVTPRRFASFGVKLCPVSIYRTH